MSDTSVIYERRGRAGHIQLNRPQSMNALTLEMVRTIAQALHEWEDDDRISCVIIEGAGDHFCAGGDIRTLYEQGRSGDYDAQLKFWREEYALNAQIARYPKPYAAFMQGVTMGGGVGLSIHGAQTICAQDYSFAMPEVGIGFFPDVGTTSVLPKLVDNVGVYLAMTGARVGANDAVALGLAKNFAPREKFVDFIEAICKHGDIDRAVCDFAQAPPAPTLIRHRQVFEKCFGKDSVEETLEALKTFGSDFAKKTHDEILKKSPTSLRIATRQMRIGADMEIEQALQTEFRIVSHICRMADFYEGVRAALIDKDKSPTWSPATLGETQVSDIDAIFSQVGVEPLVFDARSPGAQML